MRTLIGAPDPGPHYRVVIDADGVTAVPAADDSVVVIETVPLSSTTATNSALGWTYVVSG